jgi:predicted MPP superfamily phosphohydrolase
MKDLFTFSVYYGSFLAFPFLILMIWMIVKKKWRWASVPLLLVSLSFIWARFVEPQMLVVREVEGPANFVLIADTHLGQYKGAHYLNRVVERINELDPDFVVLPGDLVYSIDPDKIGDTFSPFAELNAPLYATLGNHDMEPAGELKDDRLVTLLEEYGMTWIDNQSVIFGDVQLIGMGELWNDDADLSTFDELQPELTNIVLAHNPDTAYLFEGIEVDLIVSGHTHGGQIRIPYLYKQVIPCKYDWGKAQGWFEVLGNSVYVTSGLGEIGLPMRLFNPPEIVHFN